MRLPNNIRVIERGWLNCNQVLLLDPRGSMHDAASNIVIDSGYSTHAESTLDLLAAPENLGTAKLTRIINTHCHSDHMGGNAALHRKYGCGITIPAGEARYLRPWDAQAIWMGYADQYAEPFAFDAVMQADETFQAGGYTWQALAAPGHDMDALMFWCEAERVLISGDALWQKGLGFVQPQSSADGANTNIVAALHAIRIIEACAPNFVIPGHGAPFSGDEIVAAIAFARARLNAFAFDPAKNARHVMKVMFVFALLHKGALPMLALEPYLSRVPCYQDLNQFLGLSMPQLAAWLLADLLKANAVKVIDGNIIPTAHV